jgi:UDP-galactopyranose mutase
MIEAMQEGCDILLDTDFFNDRKLYEDIGDKIIFTGAIDEFFDYSEGELEYRSLSFETTTLDIPDYQGNAIINYTDENIPYTRICEHKHFESVKSSCTVITKEYPEKWNITKERYYPVNNTENNARYSMYKKMSDSISNKYIFGGRLAEYKYYDMHQVIGSALKKANDEIK